MKYLHVTPVVGLPQVTGWSQIAENPHTAPNRLICAFALFGEQAGNVGRNIAEEIAQFEPQTLEEAYNFLEELEAKHKDAGQELYFAAGIFVKGQAAYAVKGGSVFLKRDQKAGPIIHSNGELKMIAGSYTLNDVIILATHQATSLFNEIEQKFATGYDTDTIITSIIPGLHSLTDSSLSALAFIVPTEKELDQPDDVFLEATLEETEEKSEIVVEDEASTEIEAPRLSPDDVEAPSEEALAGLGLNEAPPPEAEPNPVFSKILKLLKKAALILAAGFRLLFEQLKKLLSWLWRLIKQVRLSDFNSQNLRVRLSGRAQYLGQGNNSKLMRAAAAAVIFIAAAAVGFYLYFANIRSTRMEAQQALQPFSERLEQAELGVDQNPLESRQEVSQVIGQLEAMRNEQAELGNRIFVEEIELKLAEAAALFSNISGMEEFNELSVFYDVRLVESDFVITGADAFGNTAALVDKEQKRLVILNLERKQPTVVDLSMMGAIKDVRVQENRVLLLADGIYEVGLGGETSVEKIIEEGDSNREGYLLGAYDRFVYVLNPSRRNVYRYAGQEDDEYSDPIGWMQAARGLVYENVTSWAIDGEIWMGTEDGQVMRFASGQTVDFPINGLPESFNSSLRVGTFVERDELYILEAAQHRLVVLGKNGDFLREVKSASLASADSLIVSEAIGKALAVSGSILFEIEL